MRRDIYAMIRWWLDKGIDGFRVDAISHIKKTAGFQDMPNPDGLRYVPSQAGHMNREGIHDLLSELKRETFERYDIVTVGEASGVSAREADLWVGEENGKFDMVFQFEHMGLWQKSLDHGLDLLQLKKVMTDWQKGLEGRGWNALFLENHDQPRSVSTWGDDGKYRELSAKALATLYFLMQGTPFIYQGQEIGMTNVRFSSIEEYNDISMINWYNQERAKGRSHEEVMPVVWRNGRDNSRTPMQWDGSQHGGFTTGTPWLQVNPNYRSINVEAAVRNPDSIYHYYRRLIALRKSYSVAVYGSYDLIMPEHPRIYAYTRTLEEERLLVIAHLFGGESRFELPDYLRNKEFSVDLLLADEEAPPVKGVEDITDILLQPYESRVYLMRG